MYAKKRKLVARRFSELSGLCSIFGDGVNHLDFLSLSVLNPLPHTEVTDPYF